MMTPARSVSKAEHTARPIFCDTAITLLNNSGSRSCQLSTSARGTTRV